MKMATLWRPKDWPKVAAWVILAQLVVILATFSKLESCNFSFDHHNHEE